MTKATDQDIQKALDLRSPHVNAVVAELRELRDALEGIRSEAAIPANGVISRIYAITGRALGKREARP